MNRPFLHIAFIIPAILLLLFPARVSAQQRSRGDDDTLQTEHVIVVREFEPVIKDAEKINLHPVIKPVEIPSPDFKYDYTPLSDKVIYYPDTISAARLKGEPLSRLYRNYLKAGLGNYLNNYVQFNINSLRSRNWLYGVGLYHFASAGGMKSLPDNSFSKQKANIFMKRIFRAHILDGEASYGRNRFNYYGLNGEYIDALSIKPDTITKDDIKQIYQNVDARIGFQSFVADSDFVNYDIDLNYHYFTNRDGNTQEHNIVATAILDRYFGRELGILKLKADFNAPSTLLTNPGIDYQTNTLVEAIVGVRFVGNKWKLEVGFNASIVNQVQTKFYFYPDVEFKYNIYRNLIIPYLQFKGGIIRNTYRTFAHQNPWLTDQLDLRNSSKQYEVALGVRGAYSSSVAYNIRASIYNIRDYAMFIPEYTDSPILVLTPEDKYKVVYDTVRTIEISGEVSYMRNKKWDVIIRASYFNYEANTAPVVWNMPAFKAGATARWNMQDKIILKGTVTYWSKRYMRTRYTTNAEELAPGVYGRSIQGFVDLNLGAEYRFTPRISAFADINNIFSRHYEIWGNYQVQGINILAGLTIAFTRR